MEDEKQQAIDACACPRAPEEHLAAPRCPVTECVGGGDAHVLFVDYSPPPYCAKAFGFGYRYFCACKDRWQVYKKYTL